MKHRGYKVALFCLPVLAYLSTSHADAQVFATVTAKEKNCGKSTEVFISKDKQLLFQIHVPIGGDFEVKLNPGNYLFVAGTKEGCIAQKEIAFAGKQINETFAVETVKEKRKPSSSGMGYLACPLCYSGGFAAPVMQMPYPGPWWNMYGSMSYPNYGYPCMWSTWGCGGMHYPAGGPIAAGKPNIYIEGPNTKAIKISVKENGMQKLIATSPAHLEKGWTFDLEKNTVKVSGTSYPYLFYDSRAQMKDFQSNEGFCGSREEILNEMIEGLADSSFPKKAIGDFKEYWSVKLPRDMRFCVYPQETPQLQNTFSFSVSQNAHWTRVLYFVVPLAGAAEKAPEFLRSWVKGPQKGWHAHAEREPASARKKGLNLYEWGVAFPFE